MQVSNWEFQDIASGSLPMIPVQMRLGTILRMTEPLLSVQNFTILLKAQNLTVFLGPKENLVLLTGLKVRFYLWSLQKYFDFISIVNR